MPDPFQFDPDRTTRRETPGPFNWRAATDEQACAEFRRLDARFETHPLSPLHHDNRCPLHRS